MTNKQLSDLKFRAHLLSLSEWSAMSVRPSALLELVEEVQGWREQWEDQAMEARNEKNEEEV